MATNPIPTPEELAWLIVEADNVVATTRAKWKASRGAAVLKAWDKHDEATGELAAACMNAPDVARALLELQAENKRTAERMGFLRGEGPEALATWYMYLLKLPGAMQLAIARYLKPKTDALLTELDERVKVAEAENAKLREQVAALEEERRWVPVTERLPEVDGLYEAVYFVPNRIHGRSKLVSDVLYFERDDAGPLWSINAGCIVTHWRKIGALPAAPTEKGGADARP